MILSSFYYIQHSHFKESSEFKIYCQTAEETLSLFCSQELFWAAGPSYWLSKQKDLQRDYPYKKIILWAEIGDKGGFALGALRAGYTHFVLEKSHPLFKKLKHCVARYGAHLYEY